MAVDHALRDLSSSRSIQVGGREAVFHSIQCRELGSDCVNVEHDPRRYMFGIYLTV